MLASRGVIEVILLCTLLACAEGVQKQWTNTAGGFWTDGGSWDPPGVPTSNDDVSITAVGSYQVTLNTQAAANNLFVGGTSGAQTLVLGGAVLSLNKGGIVSGLGVLSLTSSTIEGQGNTTLQIKGSLQSTQTATKIFSSINILITGTMTLDDGGFKLTDYASITVDKTGTATITSTQGIDTDETSTVINNQGTITFQPGEKNYYTSTVASLINNNGIINVNQGSLLLRNNGTWLGTLQIANQATVQAQSGTQTFLASSTLTGKGTFSVQNNAQTFLEGNVNGLQNFLLNGGSAQVTINSATGATLNHFSLQNGLLTGQSASVNTLEWAGGALSIGELNVETLVVEGTIARSVTGTIFTVTASAAFNASANVFLYNSASFIISDGATMALNTQSYFICDTRDTKSNIQIYGSIFVSYPQELQFTCALMIQEGGLLQVNQGLLNILKSFETYGNLSIASQAFVYLTVPEGLAHESSSITGKGTLTCSACSLELHGVVDIGSLVAVGGNVTFALTESTTYAYLPRLQLYNQTGSSILQLTNNAQVPLNLTIDQFYFAGGTITSESRDDMLDIKTNVIITQFANFIGRLPANLDNVAIVNYGVVTFGINGALTGTNTLVNEVNATWIFDGQVTISQTDQAGYVSKFNNKGLLQTTKAATTNLYLQITNHGVVNLTDQSILYVSKSFYIQDLGEATTVLEGGSLNSPNPVYILAGWLTGFGSVVGEVRLKGILFPYGTVPLVITSLVQTAPGILLVPLVTNGGTVQTHGWLQITTYHLFGGVLLLTPLPSARIPPTGPLTIVTLGTPLADGSHYDSIVGANFNSTLGYALQGTTSLQLQISYSPVVTAISPTSGPTKGNTTVTITGTHLSNTSALLSARVVVGGQPIESILSWKDTEIVVRSPAGAGANKAVCVLIDGRGCFNTEQSGLWSYDAPVVYSVATHNGSRPTEGGNYLTITGSNFGNNAGLVSVTIGSDECADLVLLNDGAITCVVPAGAGTSTLTVSVAGQKSKGTSYAYDAPIVRSTVPSYVHAHGDETIFVLGSNFGTQEDISTIQVTVDKKPCKNVTLFSSSMLSCLTPSDLSLSRDEKTLAVEVSVNGQPSNSVNVQTIDETTHESPLQLPWWVYVTFAAVFVVALGLGVLLHRCILTRKKGYTEIN